MPMVWVAMRIYHLENGNHPGQPLCGQVEPDDEIVPMAEAVDPAGRYFNCPRCDLALHNGRRHVDAQP